MPTYNVDRGEDKPAGIDGMTDEQRKALPVYSGVLAYFPDAIAQVARCSAKGSSQHNTGPMRWDRSKSPDHLNSLTRHLLQADEIDSDGIPHAAKVAWRALAYLQTLVERGQV